VQVRLGYVNAIGVLQLGNGHDSGSGQGLSLNANGGKGPRDRMAKGSWSRAGSKEIPLQKRK